MDSKTCSIAPMDDFNQYLFESLNSNVPFYNTIVDHLMKNKGKQLRAKFCLLCAKMEGELSPQSHRAAMIVEMLHTASLLHDDIIDNSLERRGAPSIKAKWSDKIALLAGDVISLKALLLSLNNLDYGVLKIYGKAVQHIVKGELLQLKKTRKLNTNENTYYKIISAKTAAFFSAACQAGAYTNTKNTAQLEKYRLLGEYIGMAFQIRDDLFGFENYDVGKPIDNDFKEKKLALPIIYTINKVNKRLQRKIIRLIKKKNILDSDIKYVVETVEQNGGTKYSNQKMLEFVDKANHLIYSFPQSEVRNEIEQLIKYTINRKL